MDPSWEHDMWCVWQCGVQGLGEVSLGVQEWELQPTAS